MKFGERFCLDYIERFNRFQIEREASDALYSLASAVNAELLSTVQTGQWQPNDVFLKPYDEQELRQRNANLFNWVTLSETEAGARNRGIEFFIIWSGSPGGQRLLDKFRTQEASMVVRVGSETQRRIPRRMGGAEFRSGFYIYNWSDFTLNRLVANEVFSGMVLYYFSQTQPQIADNSGTQQYSAAQIINHIRSNPGSGWSLLSVLTGLMANYQGVNSAEAVANRRAYLVGLIDLCSRLTETRSVFRNLLGGTVMPRDEIEPVLDAYFGTGGDPDSRPTPEPARISRDFLVAHAELIERFSQRRYTIRPGPSGGSQAPADDQNR